ncbi:replication initiator [Calidifontibacter indicus]|uniref:replication initiator n=1 Tax=Calidifontibacter indicus TaxID=419650 RepID=UPI003D71BFB4
MSTLGTSGSAPPRDWGSYFPGFGEGAPLELPGLGRDGAASLANRVIDGSWDAYSAAASSVSYCSNPIRLHGSSSTVDRATGEVLTTFSSDSAPLGFLFKACGNRREHVCPACSRTYARDTFEMIRVGVTGGKRVPEDVRYNPLIFLTLTAPSFGHVHRGGAHCCPRRAGDRQFCPHGRPTWCGQHHDDGDARRGTPLCPDCYDYVTHVTWQWWAPELWRRFTIELRRQLSSRLGCPEQKLGELASVQFAKVAEYQTRGVIHFHALIRLDGPSADGIGSPAPASVTVAEFGALARASSQRVQFLAPAAQESPRRLVFGRQVDVKIVRANSRNDDAGAPLRAEQVAGYLAKYATKDATNAGGAERRATAHIRRLRETCVDLHRAATDAWQDANPYALLGKWEHSLGFRGHSRRSPAATR